MEATVKRIVQETPRVFSVVVEPERPISFKTGQVMRWTGPDGKLGRLFSVASPGGADVAELAFVINVLPGGIVSSRVPDLKAGDTVHMTGPFGKFIFDETDSHDIGLIAGGTGISVLRAIYLHVLTKGLPNAVHLLFSVRNAGEIIFREELARLTAKYPQFSHRVTLTRESPPNGEGNYGTINERMFEKEFGNGKFEQSFYLCGPSAFVERAETLLRARNVPESRIHIDRWVFSH